MPGTELPLSDPAPGSRKQVDCVEIYLPKTIEFLSEAYQFLRRKIEDRLDQVVLDGFSVYELDGVFRGTDRIWEQRTLVILLILIRTLGKPTEWLDATVQELGRELATAVAPGEEQIWICHYPQNLTIFQGMRRLLP